MCVRLCVGEWSRRSRWRITFFYTRQCALSRVRKWRSRVTRWQWQSSHSTSEQSTTTATCPRRQKVSSRALVAITIVLQRTKITTLRSTSQQWTGLDVVNVVWRHLAVRPTLINRHITVSLKLAVFLCQRISFDPYNTNYSSLSSSLLLCCMECRRGLAMRILSVRSSSVCPFVCLSVKRVHCDKTEERSVCGIHFMGGRCAG